MVSKLKVEKVLNPPQKPTITSKRIIGCAFNFSENMYSISATKAELNTLEASVAIGKVVLKLSFTKVEIPYLTMLPNPPPINTAAKLYML